MTFVVTRLRRIRWLWALPIAGVACGEARTIAPVPDTSGPKVALSVMPSPVPVDSVVEIEGSVTDASGVASVDVEGQRVSPVFALSLPTPATGDSLHIHAEATDSVGNTTDRVFAFPLRLQRRTIRVTGIPAPDSVLHQLGLVIRVAPHSGGSYTWTVDSTRDIRSGVPLPDSFLVATNVALEEGVHTLRFQFTTPVSVFDTTFTVRTQFDSIRYAVTFLGTLPGDTDAVGVDVNDSLVVVGQSFGATTKPRRAFRWSVGAMETLEGPDSLDCGTANPGSKPSPTVWVANAVDNRGDIAGAVCAPAPDYGVAPVVWLADGSVVYPLGRAGTTALTEAVAINSSGTVLLGARTYPGPISKYDIRTGMISKLAEPAYAVALNELGQVIAHADVYGSDIPLGYGIAIPPAPELPPVSSPHTFDVPVDLSDEAAVLREWAGDGRSWWVLSRGASSLFVSPYIGPVNSARLNNHGEIATVAGRKVYIWHESRNIVERIATDPAWQFDNLARFTDTGVILVHGRNTSTGAHGPVLLIPR